MFKPLYKRVLLKLSGESLVGSNGFGVDILAVERVCLDVIEVHSMGVEVGIVVGGGNIFRGLSVASDNFDRVAADTMGMLSTIINALALAASFRKLNIKTVVFSSIFIPQVCEVFSQNAALSYLSQGFIVIFSGGTGNPFLTTDTAAALRAAEIKADAILKGTQVDGVYSCDPKQDVSAIRFDNLTYDQVIEKKLKIMDLVSIVMARDNDIPIVVFSIHDLGGFSKVLKGVGRMTIVSRE
ncbi:Uridylate kinase [Liberibacter crescens BT-1]|uniref:Uridylate kinase n=1 Tax=Liberibacter crescens (strain BT-1) TaxID=1215343 RepID=L0ET91_LIBCB|nr:UMP kinase [Liberibacter crescens]AGA64035.1 Uridylate kinase [Liberibacter crescens BT-1]AMC12341.1 uridylate kinase [Liberibacter crescens]